MIDLSRKELIEIIKRRNNTIKKQGIKNTRIKENQKSDGELAILNDRLLFSEKELLKREKEYLDEIEDLKSEISDLLLLVSK